MGGTVREGRLYACLFGVSRRAGSFLLVRHIVSETGCQWQGAHTEELQTVIFPVPLGESPQSFPDADLRPESIILFQSPAVRIGDGNVTGLHPHQFPMPFKVIIFRQNTGTNQFFLQGGNIVQQVFRGTAADIVEQCRRLDRTGIHYCFFYLVGISGAGQGEISAKATADVCNRLHPSLIGVNMLTIYPDSELYQEIQHGRWEEEREIEKYREIRTLLKHLEIPTQFAALGASNAFQFHRDLPKDKEALIKALDKIIETVKEEDLREYRVNLNHL